MRALILAKRCSRVCDGTYGPTEYTLEQATDATSTVNTQNIQYAVRGTIFVHGAKSKSLVKRADTEKVNTMLTNFRLFLSVKVVCLKE